MTPLVDLSENPCAPFVNVWSAGLSSAKLSPRWNESVAYLSH
jgi:hypothetical protein